MARHPSRRVQKDAENEDAFVARLILYSEWARRHSRAVILGAVLVIIAVAGALYYANYRQSMRDQADARLTEIRQTLFAGNRPLAMRDLETFLDSFGGTPAAAEARLLLAEIYLMEERPTDAAQTVEPLARDLRDPLGVAGAFLLAAAHEEAGRVEEAERAYLRIAEDARMGLHRNRALADAGRLAMQHGRHDRAAELYRRLVSGLAEDDPQRNFFEMRRGEAEAAARSTAEG